MDLIAYLRLTRIADILKPTDEIVTIDIKEPLCHAIEKLAKHQKLTAPLIGENAEVIGIVDVLDITRALLRFYSEYDRKERFWESEEETLSGLLCEGGKLVEQPLGNFLGEKDLPPFVPVSGRDSLFFVCEKVFSKGFYRCPILDGKKIIGSLSSFDVIQIIASKSYLLDGIEYQQIKDLGLPNKHVISVSLKDEAVLGFYLMSLHRVPAVAVVGPTGELIASLTPSNIKGIFLPEMACLFQGILPFLSQKVKKPALSCKMTSTLESVLLRLSASKQRTIWVVNEEEKPIGQVSLLCIFLLILRIAKQEKSLLELQSENQKNKPVPRA